MICDKALFGSCAFITSANHVLHSNAWPKAGRQNIIGSVIRPISTRSSRHRKSGALGAVSIGSSQQSPNETLRGYVTRGNGKEMKNRKVSANYQGYPRYVRLYARSPWTIASFGLAKLLPTISLPLVYSTVHQVQGIADMVQLISIFIAVAVPMHMLFRPVVADIHLKLPVEARHSPARFSEYVKNLPRKEPVLTFTTLSFFGLPSRTEESLDDLRVARSSFADYLRPAGEMSDPFGRNRYILRSQKKSGLIKGKYEALPGGDGERSSEFNGIWSEIFKQIKPERASK